jgi:hypothetical protein
MKRFEKFAKASLLAASTAAVVFLAVAPARADAPQCADRRWAYLNSKFCPSIYGPGGIPNVGANYYGYYDSGYYGPGYYEPSTTGFVFIDASGHRKYHSGKFNGGGFHGKGSWHKK